MGIKEKAVVIGFVTLTTAAVGEFFGIQHDYCMDSPYSRFS